jgi:hypothetical protein
MGRQGSYAAKVLHSSGGRSRAVRARYVDGAPPSAISQPLELVERARHPPAAAVQNMRVDHRCFYIAVAEYFLYRAYILIAFQQVGGK